MNLFFYKSNIRALPVLQTAFGNLLLDTFRLELRLLSGQSRLRIAPTVTGRGACRTSEIWAVDKESGRGTSMR